MMSFRYILIFLFFVFIFSCKNHKFKETDAKIITNKYASGFEINEIENGFIVKIKDFNKNNDSTIQSFLLTKVQQEKADNNVINIPVRKIVCLSTTHCAFISTLGEENTIKGIGGTNYVYDFKIRSLINRKEIQDVGYDNQLNLEKILSINPDVVFAFGIDNAGISSFQKLIDVGIPVVFVGDFKEKYPLGRTEWIKLFGCFFNKYQPAVHYFDSVESNYNNKINSIKTKLETQKPRVLVGLPWLGTWWVPGGDSFFAKFIKDAGGDYIFSDNSLTESIPKTIEEIFSQAKNVDIWLNPGSYNSKRSMLDADKRIQDFPAFTNSEIYNNNNRVNNFGGNDFWESGVVQPDRVLNDLILIFSRKENIEDDLYYYKRIE